MNTVLDPLWITKGNAGIDEEYYKYIILAANIKWKNKIDNNDIDGFNEIIFHILNLNNLAVDGTIFDFNYKLKKDHNHLIEIRNNLKTLP